MDINNKSEQFIRNLPKLIENTFDSERDIYKPTHLQKKTKKKPKPKKSKIGLLVIKMFCKLRT